MSRTPTITPAAKQPRHSMYMIRDARMCIPIPNIGNRNLIHIRTHMERRQQNTKGLTKRDGDSGECGEQSDSSHATEYAGCILLISQGKTFDYPVQIKRNKQSTLSTSKHGAGTMGPTMRVCAGDLLRHIARPRHFSPCLLVNTAFFTTESTFTQLFHHKSALSRTFTAATR